ncbi:hypothetical protein [Nocardia rhizosphaerae]|uniref:Uncharacterized protein n=1 Tax=Nocardia rhizosphaerae TaxID=1691571 RepID=A0ABV8L3L8_9NOCA
MPTRAVQLTLAPTDDGAVQPAATGDAAASTSARGGHPTALRGQISP